MTPSLTIITNLTHRKILPSSRSKLAIILSQSPKHAVRRCRRLFFANYERLVDGLPPDEKLVFADAVHAEHQSRPTHGWFLKGDRPAVNTTTGRRLVNIYGVLEREEMRLVRVKGKRINAETTMALFKPSRGLGPRPAPYTCSLTTPDTITNGC